MADSLIRWKRGDYIKLSKAVASYNRKLNAIDNNEAKYLPSLKNYKQLKKTIMSRKEFNRVVKSLKRFNIGGAEDVVNLPSGESITKWEYHEVKLARNRALNKLREEGRGIIEADYYEAPSEKMGSKRLKEISRTIDRYEGLELQTGSNLKETIKSVMTQGRFDIDLVRFEQFRTNFMNALEEMSTYDNYEELKYKLEQIRNPEEFHDFIEQSPELMDLFLYYKDKATAQTYGGYASNQDAFNAGLERLGITVEV